MTERLAEYVIKKVDGQSAPVKLAVLDLSTSRILDKSMIDLLKDLKQDLKKRGIDLRLANVIGANRDALEKAGLTKEFNVTGESMTIDSVIKDWQAQQR